MNENGFEGVFLRRRFLGTTRSWPSLEINGHSRWLLLERLKLFLEKTTEHCFILLLLELASHGCDESIVCLFPSTETGQAFLVRRGSSPLHLAIKSGRYLKDVYLPEF